MFKNAKYLTRGVQSEIPIELQIFILNTIANCSNSCRENSEHNKAEEESVLSHGDDDNAVMCRICRQICVICGSV